MSFWAVIRAIVKAPIKPTCKIDAGKGKVTLTGVSYTVGAMPNIKPMSADDKVKVAMDKARGRKASIV